MTDSDTLAHNCRVFITAVKKFNNTGPGVKFKMLFLFITDTPDKKARVFFLACLFSFVLYFAGANPSGALLICLLSQHLAEKACQEYSSLFTKIIFYQRYRLGKVRLG